MLLCESKTSIVWQVDNIVYKEHLGDASYEVAMHCVALGVAPAGVVPLLTAFRSSNGNDVIAMPRVDPLTRHKLFVDQLQQCVDIVTCVDSVHRACVHNDLKPENMGVLNGSIVLLDFGLATPASPSDCLLSQGT